MKIRVDKQFRERLQQMIKKNEYEIFALIISLLPASKLVKLLTNLLQEAMTQPGRAAFADVILKTGQINITDLTAKQVRLNQHVQRLETQMEHLGDGKKARCKKTSIQEQLRFFKQKQEGSPSVLVEAAKSYKPR